MSNIKKYLIYSKKDKSNNFTFEKNQAFSLIELSISLIIISILIGTVFTLQQIKSNTYLYSVIDKMNKLNFAYQGFKSFYSYAPGDLPSANLQLSSSTSNGNGNGFIDYSLTNEPVLALQHLSLAGFIQGSYCGNWSKSLSCLNIFPGNQDLGNVGYYFTIDSISDAIYYVKIQDNSNNGVYDTTAEQTLSVLSPIDAAKIDNKYDDGLPLTGSITANNGSDFVNGCINSNSYNQSEDITCYIANIISF